MQLLLKEARDPLAEWLDKKKGATVTEHSIFSKLSQHWESEFHKDMDALNVILNKLMNMEKNLITKYSFLGVKAKCTDKS